MSVSTFTKTGNKATTPVKLDSSIFAVSVESHELLKQAYVAYLSNGRLNLAVTKERGDVRGGGRKPWKQKGTGRARFGSSRNPIWRGGGITFGPTGNENYTKKLPISAKRTAIRQALSMAAQENRIKVIESFDTLGGKTKEMVTFLAKIEATGNVICVVAKKNDTGEQAVRNIQKVKVIGAMYLNVYDVVNADSILIAKDALPIINEWLAVKTTAKAAV